jgi:hypothetical protein
MSDILTVFYIAMGLVYPLSEHVDIFPVRLVSTFPLSILRLPYSNHLSYMVVFILAGGIKDKGWILFLLTLSLTGGGPIGPSLA